MTIVEDTPQRLVLRGREWLGLWPTVFFVGLGGGLLVLGVVGVVRGVENWRMIAAIVTGVGIVAIGLLPTVVTWTFEPTSFGHVSRDIARGRRVVHVKLEDVIQLRFLDSSTLRAAFLAVEVRGRKHGVYSATTRDRDELRAAQARIEAFLSAVRA